MSFVHCLLIGRFAADPGEFSCGLVERAEQLRVPLRGCDGTMFVVPFDRSELKRIEEEVRRRFDLVVDLGQCLLQGYLWIQYTGMRINIARPVATVAYDLYGALAWESGRPYDPAVIARQSLIDAQENAERTRIFAIADGWERLRQVVSLIQPRGNLDGPDPMPPWLAIQAVRDVAPAVVEELVELLRNGPSEVQFLACNVFLEMQPVATDKVVPALPWSTCVPRGQPLNAAPQNLHSGDSEFFIVDRATRTNRKVSLQPPLQVGLVQLLMQLPRELV